MDVEIVLEDMDDFADRAIILGVRIVSPDVNFDDVASVVRARGGLWDILHTYCVGPSPDQSTGETARIDARPYRLERIDPILRQARVVESELCRSVTSQPASRRCEATYGTWLSPTRMRMLSYPSSPAFSAIESAIF